jgi:hypothetical protein
MLLLCNSRVNTTFKTLYSPFIQINLKPYVLIVLILNCNFIFVANICDFVKEQILSNMVKGIVYKFVQQKTPCF